MGQRAAYRSSPAAPGDGQDGPVVDRRHAPGPDTDTVTHPLNVVVLEPA